jgi:hypothetical protein
MTTAVVVGDDLDGAEGEGGAADEHGVTQVGQPRHRPAHVVIVVLVVLVDGG